MIIQSIRLDDLKAYDGNAKKHTKAQIKAIANSIKEFGFRVPIIAWHDEDGQAVIVSGHGRCAAAKSLGMDEVPCVFADDLSDAQRRALTLADNQSTMLTGWDESQLNYELETLAELFDMEDFGFDLSAVTDELDAIAEELAQDVEPDYPFAEYVDRESQYVVLKFKTTAEWNQACTILELEDVQSWSTRKDGKVNKGYRFTGIGRVVDGADAMRKIAESSEVLLYG